MFENVVNKAKKILNLLTQEKINWQAVEAAIVDLFQGTDANYAQLIKQNPTFKDEKFEFIPAENLQILGLKQQTISLENFIGLIYGMLKTVCPENELKQLADVIKLFPQSNIQYLPEELQLKIIDTAQTPIDVFNLGRVSKTWQNLTQTKTLWTKFWFEGTDDFAATMKARKLDADSAQNILQWRESEEKDGIKVICLSKVDSEKKLASKCLFQGQDAIAGVDFVRAEANNIRFQIWDLAGQERFRTPTKFYFKNTKIFLIFPTAVADVQYFCNQINQQANANHLVFIMQPKTEALKHLDFSSVMHRVSGIISWEQATNKAEFAQTLVNAVTAKVIVQVIANNNNNSVLNLEDNSSESQTDKKCLIM